MVIIQVLPEAFNLTTIVGLWEPVTWKSNLTKGCYKIYTYFTLTVIILLMITQVIAVLFLTKTVDDFTEATYMLLSTINASVKGGTILLRRRLVFELVDILSKKECIPRKPEEKKICLYFDKISRYTVISCIILAEATVITLALWPILFARGEHILPLRAWHPYNTNLGLLYWYSYLHQGIGLILIAAYDVAVDTIITGFMVQACAQLQLMTFRLQKLSYEVGNSVNKEIPRDLMRLLEKRMIVQTVRHHLLIFRFTERINSVFGPVILVQFCLSSAVLCVTIYQLSLMKSNSIEIVFLILYLMSMLVEFFIYCWFGNEVTLKSLGFTFAISEINWTALNDKTLKELLIITTRSTSPIRLSCGPLITLSLESFTSILKISYSAFNILRKSD